MTDIASNPVTPVTNGNLVSAANPLPVYIVGGVTATNLTVGTTTVTGGTTSGILWKDATGKLAAGPALSDTTGNITLPSAAALVFSGGSTFINGGANIVDLRNAANAQALNIYNTYTDGSNYEQGGIGWSGGFIRVGHFNSPGTGTNRQLQLWSAGAARMQIGASGNTTLTGTFNALSGTATPAGGASVLVFGTTAGFGIYFGSGVPTVSAAQGSLYIRSDGAGTNTRMYVNNSATTGTTWTAVVTVA